MAGMSQQSLDNLIARGQLAQSTYSKSELRDLLLNSLGDEFVAVKDYFADCPISSSIEYEPTTDPQVQLVQREIEEHQRGLEEASKCLTELNSALKGYVFALEALNNLVFSGSRVYGFEEQKLLDDLLEKIATLDERKQIYIADDYYGFMSHRLDQLSSYRSQLKEGKLVEVPYVQEKLKELMSCLRRGYFTMLHGDTGSGKTELAKLAARIFSKEVCPDRTEDQHEGILLRCYRGMGAEEIFGHFSLKGSTGIDHLTLPQKVEDTIKDWKTQNPGASETETTDAVKLITSRFIYESNTTVSEYILGAIYQAAREGKVVILDEVNFAPPEMLVKLNEFLNLSQGEWVHIQEAKIPSFRISKGYGMIWTGNIDYSHDTRYGSGRYELEPSRLNRIYMMDYDYLPQTTTGTLEENTAHLKKQLYTIALASMMGDSGVSLPEGSLDKIWHFCRFARLTQIAFTGKLTRSHEQAFQSGGNSIEHRPEIVLSPRNLVKILSDWQADGFMYELDRYLYKHFISASLKPADGALLYQLAQKQGFFTSEGWAAGLVDLGSLSGQPFRVKTPSNRSAKLKYYTAKELVEAIYGKAPAKSSQSNSTIGLTASQRLEMSECILRFEKLAADVEKEMQDLARVLVRN